MGVVRRALRFMRAIPEGTGRSQLVRCLFAVAYTYKWWQNGYPHWGRGKSHGEHCPWTCVPWLFFSQTWTLPMSVYSSATDWYLIIPACSPAPACILSLSVLPAFLNQKIFQLISKMHFPSQAGFLGYQIPFHSQLKVCCFFLRLSEMLLTSNSEKTGVKGWMRKRSMGSLGRS